LGIYLAGGWGAYERERASLYYLELDPSGDPLRTDPRWDAFLGRLTQQ
jgi:hypothetical protein